MDELRERLAEVTDLQRLAGLSAWDQEVVMPPGGSEDRAHQRATIERLAHERFVDERVGELLEQAVPRDDIEADLVRVSRRDYDKARRVPAELVAELAHAASSGHVAWIAAREVSDFGRFAPYLARNLELRRRYVACFPDIDEPYDALLDDFEPGMPTAQARDVLTRLRDGLVPLVERAPAIDDSCLTGGPFPEAGQRALVDRVLRQVGVDDRDWRVDTAVHPFQAAIGGRDIRLTTRYAEGDVDSLFSALHEFGHGLYEHGVDSALARTPLAGGVSNAVHESQSRLWENMVGRGAGFWRWCFPHLQAALPERFADLTGERVQRAVNAVRPSLIRVTADEVTYGLHIIVRFELELALFDGALDVDELPGEWNRRMRDYLGVDVPDDARGVLQDVHWAEGLFGYFPTYALGNVVAGQLWARIGADLGDLEPRFAAGDFAPLREWLGEHVHRWGRRLTPAETIERACGAPIDPEPYLSYLAAKVDAISG